MSLLSVQFHSAARRELRSAVEYYDERVPSLGDELLVEVESLLQQIQEYPQIGSLHEAGTRRLVVRRFPYSIVYRIQGERVVIVALAHHRRRPGYWHRRT